ncbi:neuropeptide SIFamide receptor-like [Centruroides vittatus]|uniref:neuropeptide SIFamide receptor-like n=1 Tax=Centruroides vittatus TaxID=120091 RepID=UPI00350EB4EA
MEFTTLIYNVSENNITNVSSEGEILSMDMWMRHRIEVSTVLCIAYSVVFVLGLFGNSFVVAVVVRSPRMRTVTNYFIVNLALADILVILVCLPATLVGNLFVPWLMGWFMCKMVSYLQGVSVNASINTLVAISVDRFLAICYPLKWQLTRRSARKMIIVIWIFSLLITLPWAIYFRQSPIHSSAPDIQICSEIWPHYQSERLYFLIANLCLSYILPLCLITACYVAIWCRVWNRSIPGEAKAANKDIVQRSKLKVVKMMLVVVVIFILSWLPLYIIFARIKLGGPIDEDSWQEKVILIAAPIAQWLGASNSCINPVLYAYFNHKFRRGFVAIIKSRRCCGTLKYDTRSKNSTTLKSQYKVNSRYDTQCDYLSSSAV